MIWSLPVEELEVETPEAILADAPIPDSSPRREAAPDLLDEEHIAFGESERCHDPGSAPADVVGHGQLFSEDSPPLINILQHEIDEDVVALVATTPHLLLDLWVGGSRRLSSIVEGEGGEIRREKITGRWLLLKTARRVFPEEHETHSRGATFRCCIPHDSVDGVQGFGGVKLS